LEERMGFVLARLEDFIAGLVTGAIGIFIIVEATSYQTGSLRDMGPGFFPMVLGSIMVLLAAAMILTAQPTKFQGSFEGGQLRGILFLAAAFIAFALTIERAGMLISVAIAVFLSSLANRKTTLLASFLLAAFSALACVLVFRIGLGLQIEAY
jgi:hypothetical protein